MSILLDDSCKALTWLFFAIFEGNESSVFDDYYFVLKGLDHLRSETVDEDVFVAIKVQQLRGTGVVGRQVENLLWILNDQEFEDWIVESSLECTCIGENSSFWVREGIQECMQIISEVLQGSFSSWDFDRNLLRQEQLLYSLKFVNFWFLWLENQAA